MKKLNQQQIGFLNSLYSLNWKYSSIKELFEAKYKRKLSYKTIHHHKYESNRSSIKNKKGRKRNTSIKEDEDIIEIVEKNNKMSWNEILILIKEKLKIKLSRGTLISRCKEHGIVSYKKIKKPFIDKLKSIKRLSYCRRMIKLRSSYYDRLIFTDESSVLLNSNKYCYNNNFIKCRKNERLRPNNILKTFKYDFEKVKFWCSITRKGTAAITVVNNTMNSLKFQSILEEYYKESAKLIEKPVLLMDRESTHFSKSTLKYLKREKIDYVQDFPSNSPDLNIIENLFSIWKRKIRERNPKSIEELEIIGIEEWKNISTDIIENLYLSYSKRLRSVISAKGYNTKY